MNSSLLKAPLIKNNIQPHKPSYRPGIVAATGRREVLDEDHLHTSRSSVIIVNIAVKGIYSGRLAKELMSLTLFVCASY